MTTRPLRLVFLILTVLASAATAEPARIVVTGQGDVDARPDRASFSLFVRNTGRAADAVLAENARLSEHMLSRLRSAGVAIERLQTRGVRLDPQWSPRPRDADSDWRPAIIGYNASNRIEVETAELDAVGTLFARAVEAGANGVDSVRFTLEDDRAARDEAIRLATERALGKARVMADAAGIGLGEILELRLDHARTDLPQPLQAPRMAMAERFVASAPTMPVEAGEIRVSAAVTVTLSGAAPAP